MSVIKMTPAERQMKYRQRKKEAMGIDAYKSECSAKRKAYRLKKKLATADPDKYIQAKNELQVKLDSAFKGGGLDKINKFDLEMENAIQKMKAIQKKDELIDKVYTKQQVNSDGTRGASMASLNQYIQKISKLYSDMSGKIYWDCDFDFIRNTDKVVKFVNKKYTKKTSRNMLFISISKILKYLDNFEKEYKFYSNLSTDVGKEIKEKNGENKVDAEDKENWVSQNEISELYKNLKGNEQLFVALSSFLPPRRLVDYLKLKFIRVKDWNNTNLPKDFNYIITNKKKIPKLIIYNVYKTAKSFGQQRFQIPKQLVNVVKNYIKKTGIHSGELFFTTDTGKEFKQSSFSTFISDIFKPTGKHVTMNTLRHSYITEKLNKANVSQNTKKILADKMAHSLSMQSQYIKINV